MESNLNAEKQNNLENGSNAQKQNNAYVKQNENPNTNKEKIQDSGMEFDIKSPAGGDFRVFLDVDKKDLLLKPPACKTDVVKANSGEMQFHTHKGNGCQWWYSVYDFKSPTKLIGKANYQINEWHSFLENSFRNDWDGIYTPKPRLNQTNISSVPFVNNEAFFDKGRYSTFDTHWELWRLMEYADDFPILWDYIEKVNKGEPISIKSGVHILDGRMIRGMYEIIRCDLPETLAPKFYDDMMDILLMWMLKSVSDHLTRPKYNRFQKDKSNEIREFIIENPGTNLTIGQLAEKVGLSRTVLKDCFKHEFNVSIQQFKTEQKIRKIKESMLDTDDDFTSIADTLGMCDVKHFFRFFKQHFHDTAERWRKRNKK